MKTLIEMMKKGFMAQVAPDSPSPEDYFRDCPVVLIQNVWDYVGSADNLPNEIPNGAPPFSHFWMEYRHNSNSHIGFDFVLKNEPKKDKKFIVLAVAFASTMKNEKPIQIGMADVHIDLNGKLTDVLPNKSSFGLFPSPQDALLEIYSPALSTCLLAVSFMHCKNVDVIENGPHVNHGKRTRHGPRIKYYTLEIDPMKKVLRTEGQSETTGLKKALHICRGHFAHYSDDKPLFGKYSGTFWKPMHTRGHIEQGQVFKDYAVNSPR